MKSAYWIEGYNVVSDSGRICIEDVVKAACDQFNKRIDVNSSVDGDPYKPIAAFGEECYLLEAPHVVVVFTESRQIHIRGPYEKDYAYEIEQALRKDGDTCVAMPLGDYGVTLRGV